MHFWREFAYIKRKKIILTGLDLFTWHKHSTLPLGLTQHFEEEKTDF